jgi:hypothetical protein
MHNRAASLLRGDFELCAHIFGAFPHADQAVVIIGPGLRFRDVESASVIGDAKGDRALLEPDVEADPPGLRVPYGVGDRFLSDPGHRPPERGRVVRRLALDMRLEGHRSVHRPGAELRQRRPQVGAAGRRRRSQLVHRLPRFPHITLDLLSDPDETVPPVGAQRAQAVGQGIELQRQADKMLHSVS